ncbi:hypothetical protein C8241_04055 [Paracidovorax avenae]|nr:hypothetical protein C8241_04055 [Paracidovorax avenae]
MEHALHHIHALAAILRAEHLDPLFDVLQLPRNGAPPGRGTPSIQRQSLEGSGFISEKACSRCHAATGSLALSCICRMLSIMRSTLPKWSWMVRSAMNDLARGSMMAGASRTSS